MTASNDAQIEYWNSAVGERWARLQETIDASLAEIGKAALAFAGAQPGWRVLDVGCGCGTTTLALSGAVGPGGSITGVDTSAPMLAVARHRGAAAGANFLQSDAATHLFHPTHDLVFSRFGVMFFADPPAAFANIRKALKPSGRLAFVCWRDAKANAWASAPMAAARDLVPPQPPADPTAPGPFAFADRDRLARILETAGYRYVRVEPLDTTMYMGATVDDAAAQALNIGPLARAAMELDEETRGRIRERVKVALAEFATAKGVLPPAACWLAGASA